MCQYNMPSCEAVHAVYNMHKLKEKDKRKHPHIVCNLVWLEMSVDPPRDVLRGY